MGIAVNRELLLRKYIPIFKFKFFSKERNTEIMNLGALTCVFLGILVIGFVESDNTGERVKKLVAEQLGVDVPDVTNDANFANDLGADDLDQLELIHALEEEFDIGIPDDKLAQLTT